MKTFDIFLEILYNKSKSVVLINKELVNTYLICRTVGASYVVLNEYRNRQALFGTKINKLGVIYLYSHS